MSFGGSVYNAINGFLGGDTSGAQATYQGQLADIENQIKNNWSLPDYDQTPLTPQQFTVLNMFNPQLASYVQQNQPQMIAKTNDQATQAQNQALQGLSQLSKTGVDAGMQAQLESAQMSADQALRSNKAQALQALQARGLGSSGATLGADIATSLGAAAQQRQGALQAAQDAANRKVQAIQGLGNLGSQIAGQEQQQNEYNAGTQNNYDTMIANRRQQYNNYVAQTQNEANMFNQQQQQQAANANTAVNNQFNMYNRSREDQNKTNTANSKNSQLAAETGIQGQAAQQQFGYDTQQAQNATQTMMGLFSLAGQGVKSAMSGLGGPAGGGGGTQVSSPSGYGGPSSSYSLGGGSMAPAGGFDTFSEGLDGMGADASGGGIGGAVADLAPAAAAAA